MSTEYIIQMDILYTYSRKYRRSLNLAVLPQMTFLTLKVLADLNLVVWYGITIRACTRKKLADFYLVAERHTAKPPNLIPHQIFRLYGKFLLYLLCKGSVCQYIKTCAIIYHTVLEKLCHACQILKCDDINSGSNKQCNLLSSRHMSVGCGRGDSLSLSTVCMVNHHNNISLESASVKSLIWKQLTIILCVDVTTLHMLVVRLLG